MDLVATSMTWDEETKTYDYGTGLVVEIPNGYFGMIVPRSSIFKQQQILSNHVGIIDSEYRGEIKFKFRSTHNMSYGKVYKPGDRIGQLIILPYPQIEFLEVDELTNTERGTNGFGSSGV